MAEGQQSSRRRFVYSVLRGGISSTAPYGMQGPLGDSGGGQAPPPLIDGQNMIWHRGALRPAWRWTPLNVAAHVNPPIDGNIASRQQTASTNAQYVIDAMLISSSSSGQQVYVILTDGEVFINGIPKNPDLGHAVDLAIVGAGFTAANQPANEAIELISDNAGDTTQNVTLYGITTGTDTVVAETVTLNGVTQVVTTKTNWGVLLAASVSAATAGTITIREASGNATIVSFAPADPRTKGIVTVPDTQEARSAYYSKPSFVADGATTRQIGIQGLDANGAVIYDSQAMTGTTQVLMNTSFNAVTAIFTGDLESARTFTMSYGGFSDYTGTGTGTSWKTTGVKVGDLFRHGTDSTWRVISAASSNTDLDTATSPASGASGVYQIRRTFARGITPGEPSMVLLNGDLFVACRGAGVDLGGASDWCILKFTDIFNTPAEDQNHEYILTAWNTTGYIPAKSIIPEITEIHGIQATEDGRICIACSESGAGNRIRWCSAADATDWTGEDANFSDLVPSVGEVRAFKKMGKSLVAYFIDSIHMGSPTGDSLFPYNFHRSRAAVGTRWRRGIKEVPDGHLYVGADFRIYAFDGDREKPLTDDTMRRWLSGPDEQYFLDINVPVSPSSAEGVVTVGTVLVA